MWIATHHTLPDNKKILGVAAALQVDEMLIVGCMVTFWLWCVENVPKGTCSARIITDEIIAKAARWKGDSTAFADALIEHRLIDVSRGGIRSIHDWEEYGGKYVKILEKSKERSQKKRDKEQGGTAIADEWGGEAQEAEVAPPPPTPISQKKKRATSEKVEKPKKLEGIHLEQFNLFWKNYPKKVGRAQCEQIWLNLLPDAEMAERIVAALLKQRQEWSMSESHFILHPERWLKYRRWEDEGIDLDVMKGAKRGGRRSARGFESRPGGTPHPSRFRKYGPAPSS